MRKKIKVTEDRSWPDPKNCHSLPF